MESFLIQGFCDQFKFYKYTYILEKLLLINLSYRLVLACDAYLKQKSIYVDFTNNFNNLYHIYRQKKIIQRTI